MRACVSLWPVDWPRLGAAGGLRVEIGRSRGGSALGRFGVKSTPHSAELPQQALVFYSYAAFFAFTFLSRCEKFNLRAFRELVEEMVRRAEASVASSVECAHSGIRRTSI